MLILTLHFEAFMMQRNRALYPPTSENFADPLTFSPERWYTWQPKSWEFVPFNGGPRIVRQPPRLLRRRPLENG